MKKMLLTLGALFLFIAACARLVSAQTTTQPLPVNNAPFGWLDQADCKYIGGWSKDGDTPDEATAVHFYVNGPAGSGQFLAATVADRDRSDVGVHGFRIDTPDSLKDGQPHDIYAYGIDTAPEHSNNALLLGAPKTINCSGVPVQSQVINIATGKPVKNAWIVLYAVDDRGVENPVNSGPVDENGFNVISSDWSGKPLVNGGTYAIYASAEGYNYDHTRFVYGLNSGFSMIFGLTKNALTIGANGEPLVVPAEGGKFLMPVKVCNSSYTEDWMLFKVTVWGPSKFSPSAEQGPWYFYYEPPAIGQCATYNPSFYLEAILPNGQAYASEVKVMNWNESEPYSGGAYFRTYKGVTDPLLLLKLKAEKQ